MQNEIDKIQDKLEKILPKKRYIHTLGVEYTAACLAMRYGCDIKQAETAALLHDCAKYLPDNQILLKCRNYNVNISGIEERNPYLLHGKLGAIYASEKYNVHDTGILDAIRNHTTGKPGMTLLEKIVFTADYMEAGRKPIPGLDLVRRQSFVDLDETVYLILKHTLKYLENEKTGKEIDPATKTAYDYYKNLKGEC